MKGVLPEADSVAAEDGISGADRQRGFAGAFSSIVDEYVLSERALARGIFAPEFVRELVSRHHAGENHAERLWALVNFEIWQRKFFDSEVAPAVEPMIEKSLVGV